MSTLNTNSIIQNIKYKKLEKIIQKNEFKYTYFSSKIRVLYNKQTFTANLRIKKDSIIWISLTGPFNIEGARIKITKNRFQLIDKLNRNYYDKPLSYIKNYFSIEMDYAMLENLIIGNYLEKTVKRQKIETNTHTYTVKANNDNLITKYILNNKAKLERIESQDINKTFDVKISFEKYEKLNNQDFSFRRKFVLNTKKDKNLLDLKFYKTKNEVLMFPFEIPSSYNIK